MQKLNTILSAILLAACGFDSAGCFKDPVEAVGTTADDLGEDDLGEDDSSSDGGSSGGTTGEPTEETGEETGDPEDDIGTETGGDEICVLPFGRTLGHESSYMAVELDHPDALQLADTNLTVEMWARIEAEGDPQAGVYVGVLTATPLQGWSFGSSSTGSVKATVAGRYNQIIETEIVDGTWHHLAWSYDRQVSKIFVDGVLVSAEEHTASVDPAETDLYVGMSAAFGDPRAGDVAGLRISGAVRYVTDFVPADLLSADAVTIGAWLFAEGDGSETANDREGAPELTFYGAEWGADEATCD